VSIRVLLVNAHGVDTTVGGAERHVELLAEGMARRGFDVSTLAAFPATTARDGATRVLHDVDWRERRQRRLWNHVADIASVRTRTLDAAVADMKPDVVHTHNLPGITTAVWGVAARRSAPVVHTIHDYHLLCPRVTLTRPDGTACSPSPLLCGLRTRRLARWAVDVSVIVGVSQYVLDRHAHVFPHARREVLRLATAERMLPLDPPRSAPRVLGYIGALEHTKGIVRLLAEAPALTTAGFQLRIAGDGRLRAEVGQAAADLDGVEYVGRVEGGAKERFFEECDVGLMLSTWPEPGGPNYAVLEWLEAGRPVLVAATGGLAEAARDLPGCIAVGERPGSLVREVASLAEADAWADALARVSSTPLPTFEAWLDAHERIYRTLAKGAP
jgi:glycosyltransferase involved in cell wall biosynthesis